MKRGELWWATLGTPRGSEPGYKRPVVIISANAYNQSQINTVIVATITSNMRLANAPGNISLAKRDSDLPQESVINISQLTTVDKSFLLEKISRLPDRKLRLLNENLRTSLALD